MTSVSEKRSQDIQDLSQKARIILVDIEGTTTSIDFVKKTLFPYARKNLESYLKDKWNEEELKSDLKLLREQAKKDEADKIEGLVQIPDSDSEDIIEEVKKNVLWQMDLDRKTTALKTLQGHIWRDAYKKGEIKAHVYADVVPALKSWTQNGKEIYVYSSGSIEAQKLLFGHTEEGDLLELFSGYFDTSVGPKVEADSYSNIINKLKCKNEEVVFFTDVPKEAQAAREAGLQSVIVVRDGNTPITDQDKVDFPVITSFEDFIFEASAKRRRKCSDEVEKTERNKPEETQTKTESENASLNIPEQVSNFDTRDSAKDASNSEEVVTSNIAAEVHSKNEKAGIDNSELKSPTENEDKCKNGEVELPETSSVATDEEKLEMEVDVVESSSDKSGAVVDKPVAVVNVEGTAKGSDCKDYIDSNTKKDMADKQTLNEEPKLSPNELPMEVDAPKTESQKTEITSKKIEDKTELQKDDPKKTETEAGSVDVEKTEINAQTNNTESTETQVLKASAEKTETKVQKVEVDRIETEATMAEVKKTETEAPMVETQKTETEAPMVETQKTETEAPMVETQKTETEAPMVETQKTETVAPMVETQKAETEAPLVKTQKSENEAQMAEKTEADVQMAEPEKTEIRAQKSDSKVKDGTLVDEEKSRDKTEDQNEVASTKNTVQIKDADKEVVTGTAQSEMKCEDKADTEIKTENKIADGSAEAGDKDTEVNSQEKNNLKNEEKEANSDSKTEMTNSINECRTKSEVSNEKTSESHVDKTDGMSNSLPTVVEEKEPAEGEECVDQNGDSKLEDKDVGNSRAQETKKMLDKIESENKEEELNLKENGVTK